MYRYESGNATVKSRQNESIDNLIKRFNKKVKKDGCLVEWFERQHYKKPSEKRKEKEQRRLATIKKLQLKQNFNEDRK